MNGDFKKKKKISCRVMTQLRGYVKADSAFWNRFFLWKELFKKKRETMVALVVMQHYACRLPWNTKEEERN